VTSDRQRPSCATATGEPSGQSGDRRSVAQCAVRAGLTVTNDLLDEATEYAASILNALRRLSDTDDYEGPPRHSDRDPGRIPSRAEDPFGAIARFCHVTGAPHGSLLGMRIGIKDNMAVAGVPVAGGQAWSPAPVPKHDPVVVERLLRAGAVITAKTAVGSVISETRNPRNPRFSPGFSSSGSAAAVTSGLVDAALGTDDAGSVRIPAAWCGLVGMKATEGLVPSSYGLGEVGPITTTVSENAALLAAMVGADWRHPRLLQRAPRGAHHPEALKGGIAGLRIGVIDESWKPVDCTEGTVAAFRRATTVLSDLGAQVHSVSFPPWNDASSVFWLTSLAKLGSMDQWLAEDCRYDGWIDEEILSATVASRHSSPGRTIMALAAEHLRSCGVEPRDVARAQNLGLAFRRRLEHLVRDFDLLITPTTPSGPFEVEQAQQLSTAARRALLERVIRNTVPFNLAGLPAMTVPAGLGDDNLPTGLQIAARRLGEYTIYRAGFALELASESPPGRSHG
jgi:amidase